MEKSPVIARLASGIIMLAATLSLIGCGQGFEPIPIYDTQIKDYYYADFTASGLIPEQLAWVTVRNIPDGAKLALLYGSNASDSRPHQIGFLVCLANEQVHSLAIGEMGMMASERVEVGSTYYSGATTVKMICTVLVGGAYHAALRKK